MILIHDFHDIYLVDFRQFWLFWQSTEIIITDINKCHPFTCRAVCKNLGSIGTISQNIYIANSDYFCVKFDIIPKTYECRQTEWDT